MRQGNPPEKQYPFFNMLFSPALTHRTHWLLYSASDSKHYPLYSDTPGREEGGAGRCVQATPATEGRHEATANDLGRNGGRISGDADETIAAPAEVARERRAPSHCGGGGWLRWPLHAPRKRAGRA